MSDTISITFLCDKNIHTAIQKLADKDYGGNKTLALNKILENWIKPNN